MRVAAFAGCDAVAHCAGINREIGPATYQAVHVEGTKNVVGAAERAGVRRLALAGFVRARPGSGSPYHESKWVAEEIVRESELEWTVLKPGMMYGRGDHMLDHLSKALLTFPLYVGVGDRRVRPLAIDDAVRVFQAALVDGRLPRKTGCCSFPGAKPQVRACFSTRAAPHVPHLFHVLGSSESTRSNKESPAPCSLGHDVRRGQPAAV